MIIKPHYFKAILKTVAYFELFRTPLGDKIAG
jgi:hypothetical protein